MGRSGRRSRGSGGRLLWVTRVYWWKGRTAGTVSTRLWGVTGGVQEADVVNQGPVATLLLIPALILAFLI